MSAKQPSEVISNEGSSGGISVLFVCTDWLCRHDSLHTHRNSERPNGRRPYRSRRGLDAEKDIYERCYDEVVPRMMRGGILVADNAIDHRAVLQPMLDRALRDERMDSLVVPIGNGDLVCRNR